MEIVLKAYMESNDNGGFMAWIDSPKNYKTLVQGTSPEETTKALINSVMVAIAYKLGKTSITGITNNQIAEGQHILEWSKELAATGATECKFQLATA